MVTTVKQPPARTTKGEPPPATRASQNLTKPVPGEIHSLNVRVPIAFHQEFKLYAVRHGMSMVELVQRAFNHYKESTG